MTQKNRNHLQFLLKKSLITIGTEIIAKIDPIIPFTTQVSYGRLNIHHVDYKHEAKLMNDKKIQEQTFVAMKLNGFN